MAAFVRSKQIIKFMNRIGYQRFSVVSAQVIPNERNQCRRYSISQGIKYAIPSQTPKQKTLRKPYQSLNSDLVSVDERIRRTGRINKEEVTDIFNKIKKKGSASSSEALLLLRCCGACLAEELSPSRSELAQNVWKKINDIDCTLDVSHYNALLQVYLENQTAFSPSEFLDLMKSRKIEPNRVTYQRIIEYFCQAGDIESAKNILEKMKEKNLTISELVFSSFITGNAKINDLESAKNILNVMREAKLEPTSIAYSALIRAYAEKGDVELLQNCIQEAEEKDVIFSAKDYLDIIFALAVNGHSDKADPIIAKISKTNSFTQHCANVILKLVTNNQEDTAYKLLKLLHSKAPLYQRDVNLFKSGGFFVRQLVRTEKPIEKIIHFCEDMQNNKINEAALFIAIDQSFILKKMDYILALLDKCKLEEGKHPFGPQRILTMIQLLYNTNRSDEAIKLKKYLQTTFPDFICSDYDVMIMSQLLVKNDKFDEALDMITKELGKFQSQRISSLQWIAGNLMASVAEKGNIEITRKFFDKLVNELKCVKPIGLVLHSLVKTHLVKGNINEAVEEFTNASKEYNHIPLKNQMYMKLIELEDTENLQKVIDACKAIHGESSALFDFAVILIECGHLRQARKVLETPEFRINDRKVDYLCENYINMDKVTELEQFIKLTKDIYGMDRNKVYQHLIRAYAKTGEVQKAVGIWTALQEENVIPSTHTLYYLSEFLKANNQPVPFDVPVEEVKQTAVPLQDFIKLGKIEKNSQLSAEKSLQIEKSDRIESLIREDRLQEAGNLIEDMLSENSVPRWRVLTFYFMKLSKNGDVETLRAMTNYLSNQIQIRTRLGSYLANAYTNSGRHLEFLEGLEKDLSKSKLTFPKGAVFGMLLKYPEIESRVSQLAERYATEENFLAPKNVMWMYQMLMERYDKANEIFQACSAFKEKLLFKLLLTDCHRQEKESVVRKLLEILRPLSLPPRELGLAYSTLIDINVDQKKLDEAQDVLKEAAASNIGIKDLVLRSLVRLKKELMAHNAEVPLVLASVQIRADDTSSDSSSESSDEE